MLIWWLNRPLYDCGLHLQVEGAAEKNSTKFSTTTFIFSFHIKLKKNKQTNEQRANFRYIAKSLITTRGERVLLYEGARRGCLTLTSLVSSPKFLFATKAES